MSIDPYADCPCGSGKKFRFCCVDLEKPMEKVHRHREHHQPRMALQVLDRIGKKHPSNAWVLIERAMVHLDENQAGEAREALDQLLEAEPDHELGIVLRAIAVFDTEGFDEAKPLIYEAFLKSVRSQPELLSGLALSVASLMGSANRLMAARHFLTLAMRLASREEQQQIFLELLRLDSSPEFPYPLRSIHMLADYSGPDERQQQAVQAQRLFEMGCCEPAADIYTRLGEEQPDCAVFWHNSGLCRAWAGDEESAADALHLAAELYDDVETAVELETMAQLLDGNHCDDDELIPFREWEYRTESASALLSRLGDHPQLVPIPLPPAAVEEMKEIRPVGMFSVIDREVAEDADVKSLTLETMPHVAARLVIFDADPAEERPAIAALSGLDGERLEAGRQLFEEIAGDLVERSEEDEEEEPAPHPQSIPVEYAALHWDWHIPPRTPGLVFQRLEREQWERAIDDGWLNQPLEALRGQSPQQAADEAELRVPLTAAVYALDAYCVRNDYALDVPRLCERLGIEPLKPMAVTEQSPMNAYSPMQLNRVAHAELTDSQLMLAVNRSLLLRHPRFLYSVLIEALGRPACVEQMNLQRAHVSLVEICRTHFRHDEAIEWARKGAELKGEPETEFQQRAIWKLRELTLRLDDPDDPELMPLLEQLYSRYAPKIPELGEQLDALCEMRGIEIPRGGSVISSGAGGGSGAGEGVWQPESAVESGASGKKLWLPGQS